MRKLITIGFIAFISVFTAFSFAVEDSINLAAGQPWLTIPQVYAKLETAGYRNIEKIERESGRYEIKATDSTGQRVKLYVDPQTGEVIRQKRRDNQYDPSSNRVKTKDWHNNAECTKRRCRDDLPPTGNLPAAQ